MGGIDILVNNAGVCPWHEFLTMSIETWERAQSVNHLGAFLCSQRASNQMIRQGNGGTIITVGSVGAYTGGAMQAHYNASKAAVGSLMRSLAVALGQYGIRCNSILPGCIRTAMNADVLADERVRSDIERRTPLGRLGIPEDVVGAAIFFASDLSRFCTGSELRVDGGLSVNI
jgi:L-rhamnose 1-dehydrogenase